MSSTKFPSKSQNDGTWTIFRKCNGHKFKNVTNSLATHPSEISRMV